MRAAKKLAELVLSTGVNFSPDEVEAYDRVHVKAKTWRLMEKLAARSLEQKPRGAR